MTPCRTRCFVIGLLVSFCLKGLSASPIGGYWTWTTQFVANTIYPYAGGFDGQIQVALPDKYLKLCIIYNRCSTQYPSSSDYSVNFYDNVQQVTGLGVGEVGPWNLLDNWWDPSANWPRPRWEFTDLSQGTPEAYMAVCCGYNGGRDDGLAAGYHRIITSKPNGPGMDLSTKAATWLGWKTGENRWVYVSAFNWDQGGGSCGAGGGQIGVDCGGPTCYSLTLAENTSAGGGLPTALPANSSGCGPGQYLAGENIQLTAYPVSGWNVGSWTGTQNDGSTSTSNSVAMPASASTVTVNYVQVPQTGPPTVTTGGADGITATTATLHGTVEPNGLGTNVYFGYTTDQVNYSYTPPQYMGMGTSTVPSWANLSGLACQTSYWFYAIAYNSAGAVGGYLQPFTTASCAPPPIPSVLAASVDGITQTSAVLHASVDPNGVPTNVYFLYDITTNTANSTPSTSLSGSGAQPVSIPISALSCGTTYYYRPIAYNINTGQGTTLDWQSFNTNPCSAAGTFFYTVTPCRVLDTRPPVNAPISASSGRAIQIAGLCGIPSTATAVTMNVTAVGATSQGILSVYPAGSVPPNYTVAFGAGQVRAASTVIGLSSFGTVMVAFFTPSGQGQTDFIIDVSGYFQ
jgi:hypothetical protein